MIQLFERTLTARVLASATVMILAFASHQATAQDAPPEDEFGAPDEGTPDEGATTDYTDDAPPSPAEEDDDETGDWGDTGEIADDSDDTDEMSDTLPPANNNPYESDDEYSDDAYAEAEAEAAPKNLPPVEGMDNAAVFGAIFGAAVGMNMAVGGLFALATAGLNVATAAAPASANAISLVGLGVTVPSCIWGCIVAPGATGFIVALLGDMLGKTRGAVLWPALAAYGSALALALTVGLGGALLSGILVPRQANGMNPLELAPLTVPQTLLTSGISIATAAVIGVGMSGASALTYVLMAEDRRPGDEGGGMPGIVEPAHMVPLRLGALPAAQPTMAQRY